MNKKSSNCNESNYIISDEVIAAIVVRALLDVDGVAGFHEKPKSIKNIFGTNGDLKYVDIESNENNVSIDVYLKASNKNTLPKMCNEAQIAVKNSVESMTGKTVVAVNINVMSIEFDAEPIKSK